MATPVFTVAGHLRKVPPAVRPTVQAARRTVKAAAPKAKEVAYQSKPPRSSRAMWKLARYAVDGVYVVAVGTFPTHATLFFYRGSELEDRSGLLRGSGKDLRFITLNAPADAERPAVKRIVRRAFALEGSAKRGRTRSRSHSILFRSLDPQSAVVPLSRGLFRDLRARTTGYLDLRQIAWPTQ